MPKKLELLEKLEFVINGNRSFRYIVGVGVSGTIPPLESAIGSTKIKNMDPVPARCIYPVRRNSYNK